MEIKEARATGLFSFRIEFGEFFGVEHETLWVRMREATSEELVAFSTAEPQKAAEIFRGMLPKLITESGFTSDGAPASVQDVADLIMAKGTLFSHVLVEWQRALPLAEKKSTKSGR